MSEVGPRPKRPLNAKPRIAARQGQGVSGSPVMSATHPVGPRPKRPLTAKPRIAVRQSQRVSGAILQREPRRGSIAAQPGARMTGLRRCCSHDSPRNGRHPCQKVGSRPKMLLNAKPRIAVRQGQGSAARSTSSGAGARTREHAPQAVRAQLADARTASVSCSQDSPGMSATHVRRSPQVQGGLLNAKPSHRRAARPGGQRQVPHPPAGGQDMRTSLSVAGRQDDRDYRPYSPQDSLGMVATHVRGWPKAKEAP